MWDLGNGWMSGVGVMLSLSELGAGALSVCDPLRPPLPRGERGFWGGASTPGMWMSEKCGMTPATGTPGFRYGRDSEEWSGGRSCSILVRVSNSIITALSSEQTNRATRSISK